MGLTVAIVGAGPAGFYTAAALLKEAPDCQIDIIDRLPTPFGLVRAGIAPDHQSSKKVAKTYDRTMQAENVRYMGNIEIDKDVSVDELRQMYDAVVLCVGAPADNKLGIPGEDLLGVYGSADFVRWYNCHPDDRDLNPDLTGGTAVVIGAGNVALDVARLLAKTGSEVEVTDMADHAISAIDASPLKDVYVFARRGPVEAAFTHKELMEFGELENAVTVIEGAEIPDEATGVDDSEKAGKERNLSYMREYASNKGDEKPVCIHLHFLARPVEIMGDGKVQSIRLERTKLEGGRAVGTGETFEVDCQIVVSCIGTYTEPLTGVPYHEKWRLYENDDGFIEPGLYVAGWAKRGPSGTVGTNHADGVAAAKHVMALTHDPEKTGGEALRALMAKKGVRITSYEDWKKIEAAEEAAARPGAPRRKLIGIEDMLSVLD